MPQVPSTEVLGNPSKGLFEEEDVHVDEDGVPQHLVVESWVHKKIQQNR
jgi:hypothetical protein